MWGTITAADGARWRLGRRWLPWRPKARVPDGLPTMDLPDVDGVIGAILLAIAAIILIPLLVILMIVVAEWLLVLLLLPLAMLARAAFGVPWTVYARVRTPDGRGQRRYAKVRGWR